MHVRFTLAALFLLAGHSGGSCAHTGSAAHASNAGHGSFSGAHLPVTSSLARGASAAATHATPVWHPHVADGFAAGLRHALVAAFDAVLGVAADDAAISEPPPDDDRTCQSAEDCGDGELQHGTVCDHWSQEPRSLGICREACRTDDDCPPALECHWGLDPEGPSWGGCVE